MERMSKLEFRAWLENRTRAFSVAVLKALDVLPKKLSTKVVANQLGRSATSIGANYREANRTMTIRGRLSFQTLKESAWPTSCFVIFGLRRMVSPIP